MSQTSCSGGGRLACFRCGNNGKRVGCETVAALATLADAGKLNSTDGFYFCESPDCDVVYFDSYGKLIHTADVRTPVFQKNPGPDVPACYCFGHTRRSIAGEVEQTGKSTVIEDIKQKVKAGLCACETTNPQGTCCLGNVGQVVRAAMAGRGGKKGVSK